jgi:hypothetical protein
MPMIRSHVPRRTRASIARCGALVGAVLTAVGVLAGCSAPTVHAVASDRSSRPGVTGEAAAVAAATPTPVDSTFTAGRFSYRIGTVAWDQQARLASANRIPPAAVKGYGWALVPLTVRNASKEPATPGQFTVTLHAGGLAVSHRQASAGVVRLPDEFRGRLLQAGEELDGNLGFWMPDTAVDDPGCWIEVTAWAAGGRGVEAHRFLCD